MENLLQQFRSLTKYWWAVLLLGIFFVVVSILVFTRPAESFFTLAMLFAVGMLLSGILELAMAITETYLPGRGWVIASGIIEIILGVVLIANPAISAAILPYLLAFWLIFRGVSLIGLASDLRRLGVSGMGWTIALAVLLIIASIIILFNPLFGAGTLVVITGVALMIAGIASVAFSIDLYQIKKKAKQLFN